MKRQLKNAFLTSAAILVLAAPAAIGQPGAPLARGLADSSLEWGPCPEFLPKGCQIAVLHGDPAERNADIFFKVPGKSSIAAHTHTSAERMILVAGELDVTYVGHQPVKLKPGMYAYGPPGLSHSAECRSATPCVLFIAFEEPVDAIETKAASK